MPGKDDKPSKARSALLDRIIADVALNGIGDRSLRNLAEAVGTSHRMLHHHFGSRANLVAAIVESVESAQRNLLDDLSTTADDNPSANDVFMAMWHRVSSEELRPFVRLFFECVALTSGDQLHQPWMDAATTATHNLGVDIDEDFLRIGIALTRGLLVEVLMTGDIESATRSLEVLLEQLEA